MGWSRLYGAEAPLTVKAYFVLGIVALLALGEGLLLWRVYRDGERREIAAQKSASAAQKEKDDEASGKVIRDLRERLSQIPAPDLRAPPVRLCSAPSRVPAPADAKGTAPESAPTGGVPSLRAGDRASPDVGPSLRTLAAACRIAAQYQQTDVAWAAAVGEAK